MSMAEVAQIVVAKTDSNGAMMAVEEVDMAAVGPVHLAERYEHVGTRCEIAQYTELALEWLDILVDPARLYVHHTEA